MVCSSIVGAIELIEGGEGSLLLYGVSIVVNVFQASSYQIVSIVLEPGAWSLESGSLENGMKFKQA